MKLYAKKQSFLGRKIVVSVVILIVLVAFLNIFQAQVRNSFFWTFAPASKMLLASGKSASGFFGSFLSISSLNKENTALRTENQSLLAGLAVLQEAVKANQDLRVALENTKHDGFKLLQAKTTGLELSGGTMLIDKGAKNGVAENMPVISGEKALFGKVSKVYSDFSEVMFISNTQSALAVKIQNVDPVKPAIYGALKGRGGLEVYMDLISADVSISRGDVLVTSGQEGIFPKDLLVGKIEAQTAGDAKAFLSAEVTPFFNPKNTDSVFVITNYLKK